MLKVWSVNSLFLKSTLVNLFYFFIKILTGLGLYSTISNSSIFHSWLRIYIEVKTVKVLNNTLLPDAVTDHVNYNLCWEASWFPKWTILNRPQDYRPIYLRPINLIGAINKVLSKVLAIRLMKILNLLVSDTQSANIEWSSILDGPLVINEVLSWIKKLNIKPSCWRST